MFKYPLFSKNLEKKIMIKYKGKVPKQKGKYSIFCYIHNFFEQNKQSKIVHTYDF